MNIESLEIAGDDVTLVVRSDGKASTFIFNGKVETTVNATSVGYLKLTVSVTPEAQKVDLCL